MDRTVPAGVPKIIYVLIIVILAGMYYYAAYVDVSNPEKVVADFYNAYFDRDYDKVAENLSVFWSVQFLPQYTSQSPAELLKNRDEINKEMSQVFAEQEKENPLEGNYAVETHSEYTRQGTNSALVVYSIIENGNELGMEMALLINEAGQFRIFSMTPVTAEALQTITEEDLQSLEESFTDLLATE